MVKYRYDNWRNISSITGTLADILGVSNDLYDKNLYAYCDNNPVMRKDSSGEIWIAAVAVGVATQYAGDVIGNCQQERLGRHFYTNVNYW